MKKSNKNPLEGMEPVFIFENPEIEYALDKEMYGDEKSQKDVKSILDAVSGKIVIDKSCVDFKGTKYKDVFLTEEGWDDLAQVVRYLAGGGQATKKMKQNLDYVYRMMIQEYLTKILELYGYQPDYFMITVTQKKCIEADVQPDLCEEWKYYGGDWRDR